MPSPSEISEVPRSATKTPSSSPITPEAFALALLVACSLQIIENLLPRIPFFPWMRLGLSYVVILPFLLEFGPIAAFALLGSRNLIAILYGGQPFTTFLIGTGAGGLALLGLGSIVRTASRRGWMGILAASILLAVAFNLGQLALVKWFLIQHTGFYFLIGPMLTWSLFSGTLIALLVRFSEADLAHIFTLHTTVSLTNKHKSPISAASEQIISRPILPFLLGLLALFGLFIGNLFWIQVPSLIFLLSLSQDRGKLLLAAWPFFFYLVWLHLFHTPGEYLFRDWITREGLNACGIHVLRLGNYILLGRWLTRQFPWRPGVNSQSPYLQGFLLALPLLANMFESSLEFGREIGRRLWAGQRKGVLTPAFEAWQKKMEAAVQDAQAGTVNP